MPPDIALRAERNSDAAAIETLFAASFGPGRHARTAHRIREGRTHDAAVSFVAERAGLVIGAIRQTRVEVGGSPAYLLGPLAVAETAAKRGIGRALLDLSLAAARNTPAQAIVLVGDAPFYGPFGFACVADRVVLPGPVERHRLLCLPLRGPVEGTLLARAWR